MTDAIECSGFFAPTTEDTISCLDAFQASGVFQWFFGNILEAFYNFAYAITHPGSWLTWIGSIGGWRGSCITAPRSNSFSSF